MKLSHDKRGNVNKICIFHEDVSHDFNTRIAFHEKLMWLLKNYYLSEYAEEEQISGQQTDRSHTIVISARSSLVREFNHTRKLYTRYTLTPYT